jgi:hypothetical protein
MLARIAPAVVLAALAAGKLSQVFSVSLSAIHSGRTCAMSKQTKADIERMVRAYWKKEAAPREVRTPRRSAPAVQKLATEWLYTTGFDLGKATRLLAQRRAEFDRSAPKAAAAAARRWAGRVKRTQASAAAWGSNMMAVAGGAPPGNSFFLDRPVSILASDVNTLKERHLEAGKSFAKVLVNRKSSTVDTVSFIFGFRNPAAMPFVFDFDTLLNVSGHLDERGGRHRQLRRTDR